MAQAPQDRPHDAAFGGQSWLRGQAETVGLPLVLAVAVLATTFIEIEDRKFAETGLPVSTVVVALLVWCATGFGLAGALAARRHRVSWGNTLAALTCIAPIAFASVQTGGITSLYMLLTPSAPYWASRRCTSPQTALVIAATIASIASVAALSPGATDAEDVAQVLLLCGLIVVVAWSRQRLWVRLRRQTCAMERANVELSRMVRELDRVRAKERYELSARIHDTALQQLIASLLHHDLVTRAFEHETGPVADAARRSESLVREAVQALRQVLRGSESLALEHSTLDEAIAMVEAELHDTFGVTLERAIDLPEDLLGHDSVQTLHRLLVEAITNAAKHAQTDSVHVQVQTQPDKVVATVRDEGTGLPAPVHLTDAAPDADGMGLRLMVERVREAGGTMRIDSTPGAGTTVRFELPLTVERGDGA